MSNIDSMLATMDWQDLTALENKIKKLKNERSGSVVTKSNCAIAYWNKVYRKLEKELKNNGVNDDEIILDTNYKIETALFKVCDFVLGNYKLQKTHKHKDCYAPTLGGSIIPEKIADRYVELYSEMCDLLASKLPE